ncbi:MAG: hypothetical protein M0R51_09595 [Clostridia bacterium]|jgi:ribonuclease HI|nr:hypothetical protein [Clostridia bacterium]
MIYAYVDGSYKRGFSTYAGWAVVFVKDGEIFDTKQGQTDEPALSWQVDGEIQAAKVAIDYSFEHNLPVTVCYDYLGIEMWATNKWKAESKIATNYKSYAKNKLNLVKFKKVKAHSGDEFNELADELAKESILGEFFT